MESPELILWNNYHMKKIFKLYNGLILNLRRNCKGYILKRGRITLLGIETLVEKYSPKNKDFYVPLFILLHSKILFFLQITTLWISCSILFWYWWSVHLSFLSLDKHVSKSTVSLQWLLWVSYYLYRTYIIIILLYLPIIWFSSTFFLI